MNRITCETFFDNARPFYRSRISGKELLEDGDEKNQMFSYSLTEGGYDRRIITIKEKDP